LTTATGALTFDGIESRKWFIISIIGQTFVQNAAAGSHIARTKSSPTAAGNGRWQRIQRPNKPAPLPHLKRERRFALVVP
jgi:hypothetical protein